MILEARKSDPTDDAPPAADAAPAGSREARS